MTRKPSAIRPIPPSGTHRSRNARRTRRAFSLAEVLIAILLTSGLLVVALTSVGDTTVARFNTLDHGRGQLLASQLMSEILRQAYEEPDDQPVFGPEGLESVDGRAAYDDVDDYRSWTATSPLDKSGAPIPGLVGWIRSVEVDWVDPNDLSAVSVTVTDVKRITVTVTHNDLVAARLVAVRTRELPPPIEGLTVLYVVGSAQHLTAQETARIALMESWDFVVELIDAAETQDKFDAALADVDVAYVSEPVSDVDLDTKLVNATVGVVNEEGELTDEFGIVYYVYVTNAYRMSVDDNTHYITKPFDLGWLNLSFPSQPMLFLDLDYAPGADILGSMQYLAFLYPGMAAIEASGLLFDGSTAAGRRVQLPWGPPGFDINALTTDGQTILKRSIEWAADREQDDPPAAVCGDGSCQVGEDCCTCSDDCGLPDDFESPLLSCADGLDNDCDGSTDCDDSDCSFDPTCLVIPSFCGDLTCDSGEDCHSCAMDCMGSSVGPPAVRYCCGDGILSPAEGDGTICDGNP